MIGRDDVTNVGGCTISVAVKLLFRTSPAHRLGHKPRGTSASSHRQKPENRYLSSQTSSMRHPL